jgi:hypothetical protein
MATREEVARQALALSLEDRVYLVGEIERSVAEETGRSTAVSIDQESLTEWKRRSAAYRAGETTSRSTVDVLAEIRQTLAPPPSS